MHPVRATSPSLAGMQAPVLGGSGGIGEAPAHGLAPGADRADRRQPRPSWSWMRAGRPAHTVGKP
ncbi:hypothetical protein OPKNFCMD_5525 [Methylobacterium crusticola]|uniref:Uncharacterized protein n=1 Tax=Methylobacterium crusticola TaxID=1697972 RepID=A0ABQ4R566_9HYPH|nr:hypothetical protein OPKNFCMD_5525 [Methylobacterium crusticola]